MTDPVVIGIREVYDAVTNLTAKIEQIVTANEVEKATINLRVTSLEKKWDAEGNKRWQMWLCLLSAFVAIVMGALGFVVK